MTINEYNSLMDNFMDSLLKKSYNNELKWASSVNSDGSITYEAIILPEDIAVTFIIYENRRVNIYITIDNCCTKINCNISANSNVEMKIYELKCVLENNANKVVLNRLKELVV